MNRYPALRLPSIEPRIERRGEEEFIFDSIRKKFLLLTPEEWVRQHFVNLLVKHLKYPAGLIQLEKQHDYNQLAKRTDITVLDKEGKPFLLVECKSADVTIEEKVLSQIALYNKSLSANYISVTNGLKHFVWRHKDGEYVQLSDFPIYPV